ncbi:restriction endonuclease subunit S [Halobacterium sp. NMX12-1]|uniref:Restriction endonuclease subunit S n=1 Tax=Halobacterium sp. NMX12-1 TaxID=3166650 RepID=A0AAU8CDK5_9EURY
MSEDATLDEFMRANPEENNRSEWNESKLEGLLSELLTGGRPTGGGLDEGEYISIGGTQVNSEGYIDLHDLVYIPEDYFEKVKETQLQKHDILVVKDGANTGDVAIAWESDDRIVTNEHLFTLRADSSINPPYLFYFLLSHRGWKQINGTITGSAQEGINRGFTGKVDVQYPQLSEQRKIATVLYTVDRAIEKTSELIEQLERVKQGTRQDLLTSGVSEEGRLRRSPESVPEEYSDERRWTVPESWELKELSEVCSIQVGYAFKSDWYQDEGSVRVLRGANVGYGEPDWSETKYLEPDRVSEYEEYRLEAGDLIIGMDRPYTSSGFKISRLSEDDVPSLLVQRVGRFVPEACDPGYLHVVLSDWRYQKQVLRRAQGMDIPHISQTDILSPKIPIPSLDEQKRIADRYFSILERIDCEENLLRKYKTLKQGLMQDLLSGTVRTTDANIEIPEGIA